MVGHSSPQMLPCTFTCAGSDFGSSVAPQEQSGFSWLVCQYLVGPIESLRPQWAGAIRQISIFGLGVALLSALALLLTQWTYLVRTAELMFLDSQLSVMATLNHNLGYCYNDARGIKWVWTQIVTNRMQGGARSFED
jgi:hypothetical protein